MNTLIDRVARFETTLCALMPAENAAIVSALACIALRSDCSCQENSGSSHDKPNICVVWADVEEHFGMPRDYLVPDLQAADIAAQVALGFFLIHSDYAFSGKADAEKADDSVLTLSSEFTAILTGSSAPRPWRRLEVALPLPDHESLTFVSFIHDVACSGGSTLLYRQIEQDGAARQHEMTALANALAAGNETLPVFIAAELEAHWGRLRLLPALLSATLHLPANGIIIEPFLTQFSWKAAARDERDDDLPGPVRTRLLDLAYGAEKIFSVLPHLTQTVLIAIPLGGTLPLACAPIFAAAVGPFRFDQNEMVEQIQASISGSRLSQKTARRIFETLGGAHQATALLGTLNRLTLQSSTLSKNEADGVRSQEKDVDRLANDLLTSLTTHFIRDGATANQPKPAERFDPELLICEPDLSPYLARAEKLREAGIKILIEGPPGTGKTALAFELASRMGLTLRELRGSELWARGWGSSERLIKQAFTDAKADKVMLFIDEADAILTDRAKADVNRSLVVTGTSEFLKYINEHPLPMIAATNFLDDVDKAIIRRFDLVLHAKPLPEEYEILAWRRVLKLEPPANFQASGTTVIADYALTRRRLDLFGDNDSTLALAILKEVREARGASAKRDFGFIWGVPSVKRFEA